MSHTWKQESWTDRAEAFLVSEDNWERYNWPFPMGVFGTLRVNQGNNPLMHRNGTPKGHKKAFLPHFFAHGLSIRFHDNASAPFDIFYYEPDQWAKMISSVDGLESFSPRYYDDQSYGYYRTLVTLRLLPDDYEDKFFPKNSKCEIYGERDMKIDSKTFDKYDSQPAWVYSSIKSNEACLEWCLKNKVHCPILWPNWQK